MSSFSMAVWVAIPEILGEVLPEIVVGPLGGEEIGHENAEASPVLGAERR